MNDTNQPLLSGNMLIKRELACQLRRSMTKAELVLWARLRGNALAGHHFRRQVVIRGFVVDFYCHRARLAVEIDGAVHEVQEGYDKERDAILSSIGIGIIRFDNAAVLSDVRCGDCYP